MTATDTLLDYLLFQLKQGSVYGVAAVSEDSFLYHFINPLEKFLVDGDGYPCLLL
jgi:hypothetical protein